MDNISIQNFALRVRSSHWHIAVWRITGTVLLADLLSSTEFYRLSTSFLRRAQGAEKFSHLFSQLIPLLMSLTSAPSRERFDDREEDPKQLKGYRLIQLKTKTTHRYFLFLASFQSVHAGRRTGPCFRCTIDCHVSYFKCAPWNLGVKLELTSQQWTTLSNGNWGLMKCLFGRRDLWTQKSEMQKGRACMI